MLARVLAVLRLRVPLGSAIASSVVLAIVLSRGPQLGVAVAAFFNGTEHARLSLDDLGRITRPASPADVRALLGEPQEIVDDRVRPVWLYRWWPQGGGPCSLQLVFDVEGRHVSKVDLWDGSRHVLEIPDVSLASASQWTPSEPSRCVS